MTLTEAIKHCDEIIALKDICQCIEEHKQLKEWLLELQEYRKNSQTKTLNNHEYKD